MSKPDSWGFTAGAGLGVVFALVALVIASPPSMPAEVTGESLGTWISLNLGNSIWLFAAVLALYCLHLTRLSRTLAKQPNEREVVELDQMIDVWIHLFIGIGVIWTAIGMRSALQSALGEPGAALVDTAGNVLQKLVDGGILLALTTTIVGGIGGYLMRLIKTMLVGAALHDFYESLNKTAMESLVETAKRIERHVIGFADGLADANADCRGRNEPAESKVHA